MRGLKRERGTNLNLTKNGIVRTGIIREESLMVFIFLLLFDLYKHKQAALMGWYKKCPIYARRHWEMYQKAFRSPLSSTLRILEAVLKMSRVLETFSATLEV